MKTKDNVTAQVYQTRDYDKFKIIGGNRPISKLHLARLKKSIEENPLMTIIMVNEKFETIDGQHRLQCFKELGLPVNYVISKGYGLAEVQRMNQTNKVWGPDDYVEGYCGMGLVDYKVYKNFRERYGFGHRESAAILSGAWDKESGRDTFRTGRFKVKNYKSACHIADCIESIAPYYDGYRRRSFVQCMVSLLNNPAFDCDVLLRKLKSNPTAIKDCVSVEEYKILIEDLYNRYNRDKVNLRIS